MPSKKRAGPERDDSEVSGKVACARARIPARFVEKWGDANLAKMTRQLEELHEKLANCQEDDQADATLEPAFQTIGHYVADLPPRHAGAAWNILLASGREKVAPKLHGDGRLRFGRGELAAHGVAAALKLATVVLNHIDEQTKLTMDERYAEAVAPKRRATTERKREERQRPKPSVQQLTNVALVEVAADLNDVDARLRAHDSYESGARGDSCSCSCSGSGSCSDSDSDG